MSNSDALLEMNVDKLERERGISRYKAVLMAAKEARMLTDKVVLGITDLNGKKATTAAMQRLWDGKVVELDEDAE